MGTIDDLLLQMMAYYADDPRRTQHFVKVHSFARLIGRREGLDADTQFVLEAAAVVHDIGIKPAEEKYGACGGKLQEQEGPRPAREMLTDLAFPPQIIDRVCYLVGRHHTYTDVDGMDLRILLEADFLVNLYEDGCTRDAAQSAYDHIFETTTGKTICRELYGL